MFARRAEREGSWHGALSFAHATVFRDACRLALSTSTAVCAALMCLSSAMFTTSAVAHDGTCAGSAASSAAVSAAGEMLKRNPRDLQARLQLADALMAQNCVEDAIHALEEGEALHGRNSQLQSELREARSMLREQTYFEGLNRAEDAAKVQHSLLRCSKLGDIGACDQALARQPNDPQLIIAKADALMRGKRPAEALVPYRRALELTPGDGALAQKIAAAEAQRKAFVETCQSSTGQAALQACQSVLVRDASDEFEILKRMATVLQATNQPEAALDSYIAADMLEPGDRAIALAIVSLSASTGRSDALTLAARGSALLTLNRAADALAPLRQALALSPNLPEAKARLAQAERSAREEARRKVASAKEVPAAAGAANDASTAIVAVATVAAAPGQASRRYSNAAPPTRSN
jgi:tetratricopeptide (TPR) repeat protein